MNNNMSGGNSSSSSTGKLCGGNSSSSSPYRQGEPNYICGSVSCNDIRMFLVKWNRSDPVQLVTAEEANEKWPQMVIRYYEHRFDKEAYMRTTKQNSGSRV